MLLVTPLIVCLVTPLILSLPLVYNYVLQIEEQRSILADQGFFMVQKKVQDLAANSIIQYYILSPSKYKNPNTCPSYIVLL